MVDQIALRVWRPALLTTESTRWIALVSVDLALVLLMCARTSLPVSWRVLNLAVPIGVICSVTNEWSSLYPLAFLLLCLLLFAPAFWTRVPYYPTRPLAYPSICRLVPSDRPINFVDLGCGFGGLLLFLSRERPDGKFEGVEIGVLPWLVTLFRFAASPLRARLSVKFASLWAVDLSKYDLVYAFLSPAPMEDLWRKAKSEMKPGSVFVTNSFPPLLAPDRLIEVPGSPEKLYVYEI